MKGQPLDQGSGPTMLCAYDQIIIQNTEDKLELPVRKWNLLSADYGVPGKDPITVEVVIGDYILD